jgi:hypothetical protein
MGERESRTSTEITTPPSGSGSHSGTTSGGLHEFTSGASSVAAAINAGPEFVQGKTPCTKIADTNIYIWTFVYQRADEFKLEHSVGYPHDCDNIIVNKTARLGASDALIAYQKLN